MTLRNTRAIMLRNLLRAGDRKRIARLLDKLHLADLSLLVPDLQEFELRRAAAVLFDDVRVSKSVAGLSGSAAERLIDAAQEADAGRALTYMGSRHAAQLLVKNTADRRTAILGRLGQPVRGEILRALPRGARPKTADLDVSAAFRLGRIFV
jgi:Mg/Co/Ni transporter MgtE